MKALLRALATLAPLPPVERLAAARERLTGAEAGPLAEFEVGDERTPHDERIDGRLLEAIAEQALDGARGAVFTAMAEARILAALGLARVAARRGVPEHRALAALLGAARPTAELARVLAGVRVLDPCCGGGSLLVAALMAARACGAEPTLHGLDVASLAADACRARLSLLGARTSITTADALAVAWPEADLVLSNPPFLRHEAIAPREKALAAHRSGLSRQADLSAHLATVAIRHGPDVALVWPCALDTSRSAAPLLAEAAARGGFTFRLRSRVAGSFAASVDTRLAVWSLGADDRPAAEASVALTALAPTELAGLALGAGSAHLALASLPAPTRHGVISCVADVCEVRFGMKSGCNGFFHLKPLGGDRFASALGGELSLPPEAVHPILSSLREASGPTLAAPTRVLFRPPTEAAGDPLVRAYLELGEALGVAARPSCAGRSPWWTVAPHRQPAPVLYPAKISARAFGFLNVGAIWEDKKWHALFPRPGIEPWLLAAVLSATPVRLPIDRGARQLTGKQAIADIDCRILAAAPFPPLQALAPMLSAIETCWTALAREVVTTDLEAMLARPAQIELDARVGHALGMSEQEIAACRREMLAHVTARLAHAAHVKKFTALAGG